ncbi:MAG: hypothetical protein NTW86_18585 [Candidatus Sumerlaeota bacterium]|nr:hypothetical protein [Candidatus Sumerlaeota bacterium]
MSRHVQERRAWYVLAIIGLTALCFFILGALWGFRGATGAFGFLGLIGFIGLIGRKERRERKAHMDERDRQIAGVATIIAYTVFWLSLVAACMTAFLVLGPNGTVSVWLLCQSLFVAFALVWGVQSLVIVILYRKGRDGADD